VTFEPKQTLPAVKRWIDGELEAVAPTASSSLISRHQALSEGRVIAMAEGTSGAGRRLAASSLRKRKRSGWRARRLGRRSWVRNEYLRKMTALRSPKRASVRNIQRGVAARLVEGLGVFAGHLLGGLDDGSVCSAYLISRLVSTTPVEVRNSSSPRILALSDTSALQE